MAIYRTKRNTADSPESNRHLIKTAEVVREVLKDDFNGAKQKCLDANAAGNRPENSFWHCVMHMSFSLWGLRGREAVEAFQQQYEWIEVTAVELDLRVKIEPANEDW